MPSVTIAAAWAGAATQHSGVGPGALAQAGVNLAFPALFILSAGVLLYGLLPRAAPVAAYAVVTWSFILELVGAGAHLQAGAAELQRAARPPCPPERKRGNSWLTAVGAAAGTSS